MTDKQSLIVGVGGGTASGKTTFVRELQAQASQGKVTVVPLDWYYRDHPHLSPEERAKLNYDHPSAFDVEALATDLIAIRAGQSVEAPQYDFSTHRRKSSSLTVSPAPVIVVEGILALAFPELRSLFNTTVFIYSSDQRRLERRLERDVRERGRTKASVLEQWEATVVPMHRDFCEPTMKEADLVVSGNATGLLIIPAFLQRLGIG
jgi:uridine kinase